LISRIESAYNAGSKRNDEMLTHMNSLLTQQCGALEKMTAEMETLAGSFMHEIAKQGKNMSERVNESFRKHGEDIAKETQALTRLIAKMEEITSRKPANDRAWMEKAFAELRDALAADLAGMKVRDDRISDLVEKVDMLSARAFGTDAPEQLRSELSAFRDELVRDTAALSSLGQDELRQLLEKVEGIVAVGPGDAVKSKVEEALGAFRDRMIADIAAISETGNAQIAHLAGKLERLGSAESADDIRQRIEKVAAAMAELTGKVERLASVKPAAESSGEAGLHAAEITEKLDTLAETVACIAAGGQVADVNLQVEQITDSLRRAIVADMTDAVACQVEELRSLTEKVENMVTMKPADVSVSAEKAVRELKSSIKSQIAALADAVASMQKPDESLRTRLDEMLETVRSSKTAVTKVADDIMRKVAELAEAQTAGGEQATAAIAAGDMAFSDESLTKLADETANAKELVAATLSKTETIEKSVEETCRQIWAIREYAARQQERMERLQDGYDWNIIGNFCLRIIRCVDNLDDRIAELTAEKRDTRHLQLLRDELLFAMESSGVERFDVEPGADFRGQEHRLKAQSQRELTENPELVGKVAQVTRPGYQCYISEDVTKTVRPAEVRVYGYTITDEIEIGGACK
ncbi:MAG TPA: nucleotide exchange factor GrpE, partial [Sedimentisphaerales bacterium]|nr:nucleotide exchange factor GrpE [Sedimentisphaerales bacterium]